MLKSLQYHHSDLEFFSNLSLIAMHLLWLLIEIKNKKTQEEYYHGIWNFMKGFHQIKYTDRTKNDSINGPLCELWIFKNQQIKSLNSLLLKINDISFQFMSLMISFHLPNFALKIITSRHLVLNFYMLLNFS